MSIHVSPIQLTSVKLKHIHRKAHKKSHRKSKESQQPAVDKLVLEVEDHGMHDTEMWKPPRSGINFLDLPLELRTKIYELVFVSPKYIGSGGTQTKAFKRDVYKWRHFAFARSCRLVYEESTQVFFSKNGFMFFFHRPALEFFEEIGPARRRMLTKLKFTFNHTVPFLALRYVLSCTHLRELEIVSRINVEGLTAAWWVVEFKNAKQFFFTDYKKIEFEKPYFYGETRKGYYDYEKIPPIPEFTIEDQKPEPPKIYSKTLKWLHTALFKVKLEQKGERRGSDIAFTSFLFTC